MKVRRVSFAFVSAAFLAAYATTCGAALASSTSPQNQIARAGFAALQQGNPQQAIVHFTTAIDSRTLAPEMQANALINRALAYQHLGKNAEAIADYTTALQLDVMSPDLRAMALYNRGLSYQKQGSAPQAIQDYTGALLLKPDFAQAFFSRGNALRDSGQLLFALSDYERALRSKHPDTARVHYGAAMTYVALRRPLDARKELELSLAANPQFAQAKDQLARLDNVSADASATDPILTGSVAAIAGGTVAKKPVLPKAVDVPSTSGGQKTYTLASSGEKIKKRYTDRLPTSEQVAFEPVGLKPKTKPKHAIAPQPQPSDEQEVLVDVDQVPAIPVPEKKQAAAKKAKPSVPADEIVTASVSKPDIQIEPAAAPSDDDADVAADTPPVTDKVSGWTVQIASANSEDAAWGVWKRMQGRVDALKDQKAIVVKADLGGTKGVVYRVRLHGFDGKSGANDTCSTLKQSGVDCFVSKS